MSDEAATDRIEGLPHPREATRLVGQGAAEETLRRALAAGRMPHAWIFGGPPGVGKATLAYRLARFVLAHPDPAAAGSAARDLHVDPDDPTARLVAQGAHPDLRVLRRGLNEAGKPRAEIAVKDVRDTLRAFSTSAGRGGWRVVIVDAADDLNQESANALLKTIEEPPARSLVLLLANAPAGLLATIRSRCRRLPLAPLSAAEVEEVLGGLGTGDGPELIARAAAASQGSLVRAAALLDPAALEAMERLRASLADASAGDTAAALALADTAANAKRPGVIEAFTREVREWLEQRAARGEGTAATLAYARAWERIGLADAERRAYNLEPRAFVLATLAELRRARTRARELEL